MSVDDLALALTWLAARRSGAARATRAPAAHARAPRCRGGSTGGARPRPSRATPRDRHPDARAPGGRRRRLVAGARRRRSSPGRARPPRRLRRRAARGRGSARRDAAPATGLLARGHVRAAQRRDGRGHPEPAARDDRVAVRSQHADRFRWTSQHAAAPGFRGELWERGGGGAGARARTPRTPRRRPPRRGRPHARKPRRSRARPTLLTRRRRRALAHALAPPPCLGRRARRLDGRQRRRIDARRRSACFRGGRARRPRAELRRRATPPPRHATAGGRRPVYERPLTREMRAVRAGGHAHERSQKWAANMALRDGGAGGRPAARRPARAENARSVV